MALQTALQNIIEAKRAYDAQLKAAGTTAAEDVAKHMAPSIPAGFEICWTQYTPYFNDGETCTFSVNDATLRPLTRKSDDPTEDEDDEPYDNDREDRGVDLSDFGLKHYGTASWSPLIDGLSSDMVATAANAWSELGELGDDFMELAFGNHVKVIIRPDGSHEIDAYEHD